MDEPGLWIIDRYWTAVCSAAAREIGREVSSGTAVVPAASRAGSTLAVVYPGPGYTLVWCSPQLAPRLGALNGEKAMSVDESIEALTELGGTLYGTGTHRILTEHLDPPHEGGAELASLDRDQPEHVRLIEAFLAECSEDDIDEAEVEIDNLDPAICVTLDEYGHMTSFAGARPWHYDDRFDDIGILVHPGHRRKGLGRRAVHALAHRQQAAGRFPLYNYGDENAGSRGVATAAGFRYLMTVAGVSFDD